MLFVKHEGSSQARFTISKCKWCGRMYIKVHNRQMYCSDDCAKYAHMEQNAEYMRKYRRRYNQKESLGSGGLGAHLKQNFTAEYACIRREMKRLSLKVAGCFH